MDVSVWVISAPIRDLYLNVHYSKEWIFYAFIPIVYCRAHAGEQQGNGSNYWRWQFWKRCSPSLSGKFDTLTKLKLFQEKVIPGACLTGFRKGPLTPRSGGQAAQLENMVWKYRKHRVPPALGDSLPWLCSAQWGMQEGVSPILQNQGSSWAQLTQTQFEASVQEVTGAYLQIPNTEQVLYYPPCPGMDLHNAPFSRYPASNNPNSLHEDIWIPRLDTLRKEQFCGMKSWGQWAD